MCGSEKDSSRHITLLVEAAERGFDFCVGCELTAFGLGETFQHVGEMCRINFFGFAVVAGKAQHRERDLVLTVRRQPSHRFQGFFEGAWSWS